MRKKREKEAGSMPKKKNSVFLKYFCVTFVVVFALSMLGNVWLNSRMFAGEDTLQEEMGINGVATTAFEKTYGVAKRVNVLLLGVNGGMTDTMMLASYDWKNQRVDLISIPRDTYYERNGYRDAATQKINAIYHSKKGGVVKLAEAVQDTLQGMPVQYYMVVDYKGVAKIVDAIGGVEFNVPFHMKYDDTTKGQELHVDIPSGLQTLTEDNVVEFLRFRKTNPHYARQGYKGYPNGDEGRIQTQQEFMKAAFEQSLGLRLPKVMKSVLENVESDLTWNTAAKLATKATGLQKEDLHTWKLPGKPGPYRGLSFYFSDETQITEMLSQIYGTAEE